MPPTSTAPARRLRAGTGVLVTAVVVAGGLASPAPAASPTGAADPSPRYRTSVVPTGPLGTGSAQTSDRAPGWIAPSVPMGRADVIAVDSRVRSWRIAAGTTYRGWTRTDQRGRARIHVVTTNLRKKSIRADLLTNPTLLSRNTVGRMVHSSGALVGVNGDFFDISDTGAALGSSARRKVGMLQGRVAGWNNAFYQVGGRYRIGQLPLVAKIKGRPRIPITNVNSPEINPHGIGIYTAAWGTTSGNRVNPGHRWAREVVIRGGRVVANRRPSTGVRIRGRVLVAVGSSAKLVKRLKKGRRVKVGFHLAGRPAMAIGGDRPLLVNGQRAVIDDTIMHPRTAVGIDSVNKRLFLVVVDGRSAASRGSTMVELANLMSELGADNALNLDGGGSSTLITPNRKGIRTVRNVPSDGSQRLVPNGLGLFARR